MDNHKLINQDSGNTEWFTPPHIIEAAREVLGSIDLDPASCEAANAIVKAIRFYTKLEDGLSMRWGGDRLGINIWLNHPFSKGEEVCDPDTCIKKTCKDRGYHCVERIPSNKEWIDKLLTSYQDGEFCQACCITYAAISEVWFRPLLTFPQCFPNGRINYLDPITLKPVPGVQKGSCITYLGPNVEKFASVFSRLGTVKVAWANKL